MNLYELNKKVKIGRQESFVFNQVDKLTVEFYSSLPNLNIRYHLKHQRPMMHRNLFKIVSQNPDYVKTHCIDLNFPFHLAIRNWLIKNEIDIDED